MPIDPRTADDMAAAVAGLYRDAELSLIAMITRRLARGLESTGWAERKRAETGGLRTAAALIAGRVATAGDGAARRAVALGYRAGNETAVLDLAQELTGHRSPVPRAVLHRRGDAVQALADAVVDELRPVHAAILPQTLDAYRRVIAGAAGRRITGVADVRHAAQAAWSALVQRGVTGLTDSAGRRWRLSTYVEMSVRTAVARSMVFGQLDTWSARGIDQCYVVDNPRECEICAPWETKILSLGPTFRLPAIATLDTAMKAGLFHPNCFPGGVQVSAPTGVSASDSRWYEGELVVIRTASGQELPVTPNHPVLTPEGWVAAGALKVGDSVLRHGARSQRVHDGVGPHDQQVPASIGEVHRALLEASPVPAVRVPASPEQFHGDGFDSEVEVVFADRLLTGGKLPQLGDGFHDVPLVVGGPTLSPLLSGGPPLQIGLGAFHAPDGVVGSRSVGGSDLGRGCGHPAPHGLAGSDLSPASDEPVTDGGLTDAVDGRKLALSLAGQVTTDDVVDIGRREFAGHVFNLQTGGGWYVAESILVSNCRHKLREYIHGRSRPRESPIPEGPEGYAAEQRQRALERGIRAWREREAAALEPTTRVNATAHVLQWQAELDAHLQAWPLLTRKSYREIVDAGFAPAVDRRGDLAGVPI